jgi:hypothetical protein
MLISREGTCWTETQPYQVDPEPPWGGRRAYRTARSTADGEKKRLLHFATRHAILITEAAREYFRSSGACLAFVSLQIDRCPRMT